MQRRELVESKLAMEFGVAPVGDELPKPTTNDEGQPRLLVSRFGDDHATFFRYDLPPEIRDELKVLDPDILMRDEERVSAVLAHHAPVTKIYRIRWYIFERMPDADEYPDVELVDGQYVIRVDGAIAAWARTDCENGQAAEIEIATEPAFRRRGYARQVAAAWSTAILSAGKVAFYSHLTTNDASQAVASSLGVTHLSDEVEYL